MQGASGQNSSMTLPSVNGKRSIQIANLSTRNQMRFAKKCGASRYPSPTIKVPAGCITLSGATGFVVTLAQTGHPSSVAQLSKVAVAPALILTLTLLWSVSVPSRPTLEKLAIFFARGGHLSATTSVRGHHRAQSNIMADKPVCSSG